MAIKRINVFGKQVASIYDENGNPAPLTESAASLVCSLYIGGPLYRRVPIYVYGVPLLYIQVPLYLGVRFPARPPERGVRGAAAPREEDKAGIYKYIGIYIYSYI